MKILLEDISEKISKKISEKILEKILYNYIDKNNRKYDKNIYSKISKISQKK